jgi:glycerol-3-phosphate cytidylyltransferase
MIIGLTTGVFDLFHIGHLNLLENAKNNCDFLIVAVCTDELAYELKGKKPLIPFEDRKRIIASLRCVDRVVEEYVDKKVLLAKAYDANIIFKGSDWKNTKKWLKLEKELKTINVKVKYFNYTDGICSSKIRRILNA